MRLVYEAGRQIRKVRLVMLMLVVAAI